jgi:hypothetical protein
VLVPSWFARLLAGVSIVVLAVPIVLSSPWMKGFVFARAAAWLQTRYGLELRAAGFDYRLTARSPGTVNSGLSVGNDPGGGGISRLSRSSGDSCGAQAPSRWTSATAGTKVAYRLAGRDFQPCFGIHPVSIEPGTNTWRSRANTSALQPR